MSLSREKREEQIEWDLHETQAELPPMELELSGTVDPEIFGIEPVKAKEMVSGLGITLAEREALKSSYIDVINLPVNSENLPTFKELRLKIVKNRTQGLKSWHTANKAFYLAGGRFVDAIYNKEVIENEQMESKLLEAEKYFENLEKEKLAALKLEREELLRPYVDVLPNDLGNLEQDIFDSFLASKKAAHAAKLEADKLEAERIEKEAAAERERIEAQRLENERLKKEAEEKEAQILAERKAAAVAQAAIEEKARKEAEAEKDVRYSVRKERLKKLGYIIVPLQGFQNSQLNYQVDGDKVFNGSDVDFEKIISDINDARDKSIELAAKQKADAEKKEADKLAKAPVKKQLSVWVNSFELPSVQVNNETSKEIQEKFEAFKKWAINQINNL